MVLGMELPALLTGLGAMICLTAAPMCRDRQAILLVQIAAGVFFAAHYALLGIAVAALANLLGLVQTGAALFAGRSAAMTRLGYALIAAMVLCGLVFWQGPISALSVIALSLLALGRMQTNELHLRLLLLAGGFFWILHDFIGGAWIALAADIGAFTTGIAALFTMLVRVTIEWRPAATAGMPAAA
nr:YgjV family protein [Pseudoruegeria sp. HB172150]